MELKYLTLLVGILMIGSVAAYTATSSDYVILTLDETENYVVDDSSYVILTLDVTPPDTCTYSSGDWIVDCADACNITTDVNVGANKIIVSGTGYFNIMANVTADSIAWTKETCQIINLKEDGNNLIIDTN